jgi:YVTN family beta-propeller protein
MKKRIKINWLITFLLVSTVFFACKEPKEETSDDLTFDILILNEGLWNMNNSSITAYNIATKDRIGDYYKHANNNRSLGDMANDILVYGSKVYVVVNGSNQINVIDKKTGISIKQISGTSSQPRCVTSHNGKVYACYFDGSVVKIDTATLQIEATIQVGRNPDGICTANNKLYVSNSGGLDYPNYDNTVSVIDLNSFSETKKITVQLNPTLIKADKNGNVYVVSNGNYDDVSPCLQRINTISDEVEKIFDLGVKSFDIYNNFLYFYTYDYNTGKAYYQTLDLQKDSIVNKNFISGNNLPQVPYGITINQSNGDIYITDALDYKSIGDVHCFSSNGQKKFQFEAGIVPKKVVFKYLHIRNYP